MEKIVHERQQVIDDFNNWETCDKENYKVTLLAPKFVNHTDPKEHMLYIAIINQLFTRDPKIKYIVRILPQRNAILYGDEYLKSYIIYIYEDELKIYTINKKMDYTEHIFELTTDYEKLDFIGVLDSSAFDCFRRSAEMIKEIIYRYIYSLYKTHIMKDPLYDEKIDGYQPEYWKKELEWDIFKKYIDTENIEKIQDIVNDNIENLSLLINFIHYIRDNLLDHFNQVMIDWINSYLNWYNNEGIKSILKTSINSLMDKSFNN